MSAESERQGAAADPRADRDRLRRRERRQERQHGMQQQVALRLLIGGLIFGLLTVAATWLVLVPRGPLGPNAVLPVLDAYMRAGSDRAVSAAHRLYSRDGLQQTAIEEVERAFQVDSLFRDYAELEILSLDIQRSGLDSPSHRATVTAAVRYFGGQPPARLQAVLELEEGTWRILEIGLSRAAP